MNNQYVSYPPYYSYQSNKIKTSKFLKKFSHLPFLSSRASSETKGLIGFSMFVAFIILLTIIGIVGLTLMGSFFRKVDQLRNSEFSIDVQDAFQIQNPQILGILNVPNLNRTKVQNDLLEIEKIFLESKLEDHLKSKLNQNFKKIYNIRLVPNVDNGFINVSFTVKTLMMPKKSIKKFRNSFVKALGEENFYANLAINEDFLITNTNLNQKISDAIQGDITGSLQSSRNFSSLRETQDQKLSQENHALPSIIDEENIIYPYDPYLDKIEYDRKFYQFIPTQPYFDNSEQRFSDERLFEKYSRNEYLAAKQEVDETNKNKDKKISTSTKKVYERPLNEKHITKLEHKVKQAMTTMTTTVQKPNTVNLISTVRTETVKTLDEILQDLINQEMLSYSN